MIEPGMLRLRRLRSAAVLMLALSGSQLGLAASGMACAMPTTGMVARMAASSPDGMAMASSAPAREESASGTRATSVPHRAPCDQQMRIPMCQAMGPCVTAIAAAPVGPRGVRVPPERIGAAIALTPPSRTSPPELPPPRA